MKMPHARRRSYSADLPRLFNKRREAVPREAVYIGRPSIWGNPFEIGRDGTREEVIEKYRAHLHATPRLMQALSELRGKDLACWCWPKPCHGDVLIEEANRCAQ